MTTPAISVLIPVYNVEQYLVKCIESVLKQDFQDWEMILVDDGSPDNSGAICDEYAQKDCRIKVVHKDNGGLISARQTGFVNSKGKYLVFLDSDDTLANEALSILYNNIIQGYDVVKGGIVKVNQKDEIISTECFRISEGVIEGTENIIKKIFNGDIAPYLCGSIYKRELFAAEIFDKSSEARISFGEDWLTNLLTADNIQKILCIKDVVYNYFVNNESITNSQVVSIEYFNRFNIILKDLILDKKPYLEQLTKLRVCTTYIRNFFIPELKFSFDNYKEVMSLIDKEENFHIILKQNIDNKFLRFIKCKPLYYIYSRLYCSLFYIMKLHCKSRRILK